TASATYPSTACGLRASWASAVRMARSAREGTTAKGTVAGGAGSTPSFPLSWSLLCDDRGPVAAHSLSLVSDGVAQPYRVIPAVLESSFTHTSTYGIGGVFVLPT